MLPALLQLATNTQKRNRFFYLLRFNNIAGWMWWLRREAYVLTYTALYLHADFTFSFLQRSADKSQHGEKIAVPIRKNGIAYNIAGWMWWLRREAYVITYTALLIAR